MLKRGAMLAYSVAAPCELRRDLGEAALLALAVRPDPAGAAAAAAVAAARARATTLCAGCRANARGQPLGCAGLVPTPIPEAAERCLHQTLAHKASAVPDPRHDRNGRAGCWSNRGRLH